MVGTYNRMKEGNDTHYNIIILYSIHAAAAAKNSCACSRLVERVIINVEVLYCALCHPIVNQLFIYLGTCYVYICRYLCSRVFFVQPDRFLSRETRCIYNNIINKGGERDDN